MSELFSNQIEPLSETEKENLENFIESFSETAVYPAFDQFKNIEKKMTLSEMLGRMKQMTDLLDDPDFDPASIIDDIDENKTDIETKIDAYAFIIDELEAFDWRMNLKADAYYKKAKRAKDSAQRVKKRLLEVMQSSNNQMLPGTSIIAEIQTFHTPAIKFLRDPTVDDLLSYGEKYVEVIPKDYSWKANPFKKAVLDKEIECDFVELEYSKKVVFKEKDDPTLKPKKNKRGKKQ
jgi:hypothetical protein